MANVPVRAIPIKTSVCHAARASQVAVPWLGFVGGGLMEGCARAGARGVISLSSGGMLLWCCNCSLSFSAPLPPTKVHITFPRDYEEHWRPWRHWRQGLFGLVRARSPFVATAATASSAVRLARGPAIDGPHDTGVSAPATGGTAAARQAATGQHFYKMTNDGQHGRLRGRR